MTLPQAIEKLAGYGPVMISTFMQDDYVLFKVEVHKSRGIQVSTTSGRVKTAITELLKELES